MPSPFPHPLPPEDERHLLHAAGYHELGMLSDALEALDSLSPLAGCSPDAVLLRAQLYNTTGRFAETVELLLEAPAEARGRADFHLLHSYAARRARSLDAAFEILEHAVMLFPGEALIHYNFACYCAQLSRTVEALDHLRVAVGLNPSMAVLARTDGDFDPVRNLGAFQQLVGLPASAER